MSNEVPYQGEPILQVLASKCIASDNAKRYRLLLSDGQYSYANVVLSTKLNHLILEDHLNENTIIKVKEHVNTSVNKINMLIIGELTVLMSGNEIGHRIGEPVKLNDSGKITMTNEMTEPQRNILNVLQPPSSPQRLESHRPVRSPPNQMTPVVERKRGRKFQMIASLKPTDEAVFRVHIIRHHPNRVCPSQHEVVQQHSKHHHSNESQLCHTVQPSQTR